MEMVKILLFVVFLCQVCNIYISLRLLGPTVKREQEYEKVREEERQKREEAWARYQREEDEEKEQREKFWAEYEKQMKEDKEQREQWQREMLEYKKGEDEWNKILERLKAFLDKSEEKYVD